MYVHNKLETKSKCLIYANKPQEFQRRRKAYLEERKICRNVSLEVQAQAQA